MASVALSLLAVALWVGKGLGLARWLAPGLGRDSLAPWVLGAWLGLALDLVVLCGLYYLVPGATVGAVALPVSLALGALSLALEWRWRRQAVAAEPGLDRASLAVLAVSLAGLLLFLKPLAGQTGGAFYFSNNGEFSNYAAIADLVQYHAADAPMPGSPPLGPDAPLHGAVPVRTREGVAGVLLAGFCALSGQAALWAVEPAAAAVAFLALAILGCLFRLALQRGKPGRLGACLLFAPYAWASLSSAAQEFWTSSWVSQYLSITLFFGCLLYLAGEAPKAGAPAFQPRRLLALGLALGASVLAYPEMFAISAALLVLFEAFQQRRAGRSWAQAALALVPALLLAGLFSNRLALELLAQRAVKSGAGNFGWNVYGPHHPVLPFIANLLGATNIFSGPGFWGFHSPHAISALLAAGLAAGTLVQAARLAASPGVPLAGLPQLTLAFAVGFAGLFGVVAQRGLGNNYIAVKFFLGYGWILYLAGGLWLMELPRSGRRLALAAALGAAFVTGDLARSSAIFSRYLSKDSKNALFTQAEARECQARLAGAKPYIAAPWFNYAIIGYFLAHGRDLLGGTGAWPDGKAQAWGGQEYVLVLGEGFMGFKPGEDARWKGSYAADLTGRDFVLLKKLKARGR